MVVYYVQDDRDNKLGSCTKCTENIAKARRERKRRRRNGLNRIAGKILAFMAQ